MKTRDLMLKALIATAFTAVVSVGCTGLEPYTIDAPDDLADKIAAYKAEKEAQNVVPDDAVPIEISPAVVGQEDNNSGWWADFSQYFTIPVAKKLVLKFKNYSLGEANYQNWVLAVTNAKERGGDGYAEYFVLRSDMWKWGSGDNGSNTGVSLVLEANEDFYGGAPAIKTIVYSIVPDDATAMQALLNGELDWVTSIPFNSIAGLEGDSTVRLVPNILPSPQRIVFNVENELVADVAVRKAIAMCIDREDIVEKAYNNVYPVEYCSLPYMSWANNPDATYPAFDIEGASKVLEDAGYTKDADGYYVRGLTITAFESMGNADTAKLISANCEKAGIEMKPDMYEYNAWANKIEVEHSFAIELQGGFLGPDPSALGARVGTGGWASFGYSNARVDELLAAGVAEPDESKRKVYYDEIQEILVEELPYVCIAEYASVEGCASNLKNVPMDGAGKWGWAEWSKAYFE